MRLCIVGCGYVGLVTGTCLAEMGNDVVIVESNPDRVDMLRRGEVPIHEPGLAELVRRNHSDGRLHFTTSLAEGVAHGPAILICVGTPPTPNGSTDLTAVMDVTRGIGRLMDGYRLIVVKSTVPVGTCRKVTDELGRLTKHEFDVASNPEFLKEGAAVNDFFKPDRVIVGVGSERALKLLRNLYGPFLRTGRPFMAMSTASAEMSKHAANAMLAARISYMNELAALCEATGADVEEVRLGIASDSRIGPQFLFPGVGFGGSCLPKDIRSLAHVGREHGCPMPVTEAAHAVNQRARERFLQRIAAHFGGSLDGRQIAFWGLAFKPRTDDVREAPALWLINCILERWPSARVSAHDPIATERAAAEMPASVQFHPSQYDALKGAEALVICTEWNEFRSPDFDRMKSLMAAPVIFDGRNIYEPSAMREAGFTYYCVGRPTVLP